MESYLSFNLEDLSPYLFFYEFEYWFEFVLAGFVALFSFFIFIVFFLILLFYKKIISVDSRISKATEAEQERLGMILHDEITPLISISKLKLENIISHSNINEIRLREGKQIINNLDLCINSIRTVAHYLAKDFSDNSDFNACIITQCEQLEKVLKIKIDLTIPIDFKIYNIQSKNQLSKIIYELIKNSYTHGLAKHLEISFCQNKDIALLYYKGTEIGFNVNEIRSKKGLGISFINKRVAVMQGTIDFKSSPGNGTVVEISFPNHILINQNV